jgi:hypothetical protein
MWDKKCFLVLGFVGILCICALGREELLPPEDGLFLISKPDIALAGVDKLHVVILRSCTEPNIDGLNWAELESKVTNRFNDAGVKLIGGIAGDILKIQELRICISMLKLEDSQMFVFNIQTSLARAVRMPEGQNPVFKADVWQTNPVMQATSMEKMPEKVTDAVLEQVEFFIHAYKSANSESKKAANIQTTEAVSQLDSEQTEQNVKSAIENKYIASKSSSVFHKPECRSAQNISEKNLVVYNNRDEAIQAGKRPCKMCNP